MLKKKAFRKGVLMPVLRVLTRASWSTSLVENSETTIERKVDSRDEDEKTGPGRTDQVGVGEKGTQSTASLLHVEAAVAIEQAKFTLRRYNPAKPQIAGWIFRSLCRYFLSFLIRHSANFRWSSASVMCRQISANSGS